jgi:hypothetical protein
MPLGLVKFRSRAIPLRDFNSAGESIRLAVMVYVKYRLSLRNVEDLLFGARPILNFPRLRAFTVFGRRLAESTECPVIPPSKNLHRKGLKARRDRLNGAFGSDDRS